MDESITVGMGALRAFRSSSPPDSAGFLGHVRRMEDGRIPKDVLHEQLTSGSRRVGRPALRYKDICKRDMKASQQTPGKRRLRTELPGAELCRTQLLKMKSSNPIKTFSENPWKFKNLSEAYFPHNNVTFDPTRNFMSFDLGYPAEGAEDMERAHRYISELEVDFTLIMLLDYLDESIVLLKRLMCWDLQDVLFITQNNRTYPYKKYEPTKEELAALRRWKAVDYLLYDTFNRSLWRKIAAQGPDFFEELTLFKEVNKRVSMHCRFSSNRLINLTIAASKRGCTSNLHGGALQSSSMEVARLTPIVDIALP
ncbi:hypothetical protein Bbelb_024510 [Branchiostoma belcheri]|nr:hypothetical protein Bbelb_024510 [Branchiostoma belcheri]